MEIFLSKKHLLYYTKKHSVGSFVRAFKNIIQFKNEITY